jgi:ABC-type tungstate transport system substrate-binding protein
MAFVSLCTLVSSFGPYGKHFLMFVGLAIMMGTVWLRLPTTQSSIQPFINAIVRLVRILLSTELTHSIVLRLRVHVIYGRCLRACIS